MDEPGIAQPDSIQADNRRITGFIGKLLFAPLLIGSFIRINENPRGSPQRKSRLGEFKSPRQRDSKEWLRTCTIITGEPNELVAQIHPRMPMILPEEHHAAWLGEIDDGNLKALLVPYPADQMRLWEISPG